MQGKFISIEGPDGAGKSSVVEKLAHYIETHTAQSVVTTREPGGIRIAEKIRDVILDVEHTEMDAKTEALLYAAARRQHLVEKILPAIQLGKYVVCDRFVDSSLAYQGVGRGLNIEEVWSINQFAIESCLPDVTLLIDVPAEIGIARIHQARGQRQFDRLDQEDLTFHQQVRQAFLNLAKDDPRFVIIDGTKSIDEVVSSCIEALKLKGMIQ